MELTDYTRFITGGTFHRSAGVNEQAGPAVFARLNG
jgi:hypothetical protein